MTLPLLQRNIVLVLNRHWIPIDAVTPVDSFGHLAAGSARALRIESGSIQAFEWEDWRELEVPRDGDAIGTPRGPVGIPRVIVLKRYHQVRMVTPAFGIEGLWERDGGRCQYTGRALKRSEANIDHVVPRSRGGADDWENCVLSDRRVNTLKGARTPVEAGLKLLDRPRPPRAVPVTRRIRNLWNITEWKHFLTS